jgi:hypothetical protein
MLASFTKWYMLLANLSVEINRNPPSIIVISKPFARYRYNIEEARLLG